MNTAGLFESWCLVEVMGHQRYVGFVREEVIAGAAMLRVDVPALPETEHLPGEPGFTKFFGGSSIYSITPVSEEFARRAAATLRKKPIDIYMPELFPEERRALIPALAAGDDDGEEPQDEGRRDDPFHDL